LLRINPEKGVRDFGVNMSGKPSQFGVDEEYLADAISRIKNLPGLELQGFHIYSGTNSLNAKAIAANFENFIRIFRDATALSGQPAKKLVFGSGFGVPYHTDETPLDVDALADLINPMIDEFVSDPAFSNTELVLEMGRWLVGPVGWLLSSVVAEKFSRGTEIRMFDAGFNNHLAACGMMGAVIRRNWRIHNISNPDGPLNKYMLNGPLCTTIDVIAANIELPQLDIGNVIAIENSGAYGLTASPTRFISHPEPREVMLRNGSFHDITESMLNHWTMRKNRASPV
jgi:diaminopimelate decarboxylase